MRHCRWRETFWHALTNTSGSSAIFVQIHRQAKIRESRWEKYEALTSLYVPLLLLKLRVERNIWFRLFCRIFKACLLLLRLQQFLRCPLRCCPSHCCNDCSTLLRLDAPSLRKHVTPVLLLLLPYLGARAQCAYRRCCGNCSWYCSCCLLTFLTRSLASEHEGPPCSKVPFSAPAGSAVRRRARKDFTSTGRCVPAGNILWCCRRCRSCCCS